MGRPIDSYSKRFLRITKGMTKKASAKYGVPQEDIEINLADHLAQKHGWIGIKSYKDVQNLIEDIAKELSETE